MEEYASIGISKKDREYMIERKNKKKRARIRWKESKHKKGKRVQA
jgi:hypothetical protein